MVLKRLQKFFVSFALLSSCFVSSVEAQESLLPVPRLTAPVVDQAQILQPSTRRALDRFLKKVKIQWGTQLAVLVVPSLKGEPIENFSMRVVDQWKLGSAEKDDGVLLVIAQKDRRLRIEVGQGLEGNLTDAYSRRVIDEVIAPYFKKGQFDQGVLAGVLQILRYAHPDVDWQGALSGVTQMRNLPVRQKKKTGILEIIIFLIVLVMSIISPTFRTLLFMSLLSGGRGGFGGGRGGGFSGGGGGFSGGGSSGGW